MLCNYTRSTSYLRTLPYAQTVSPSLTRDAHAHRTSSRKATKSTYPATFFAPLCTCIGTGSQISSPSRATEHVINSTQLATHPILSSTQLATVNHQLNPAHHSTNNQLNSTQLSLEVLVAAVTEVVLQLGFADGSRHLVAHLGHDDGHLAQAPLPATHRGCGAPPVRCRTSCRAAS